MQSITVPSVRPLSRRVALGAALALVVSLWPATPRAAAAQPPRASRQALLDHAQKALAAGQRVPALADCMALLARWPGDPEATRLEVRLLSELGAAHQALAVAQTLQPPLDAPTMRRLRADAAAHATRWANGTPAQSQHPYVEADRAVARYNTLLAQDASGDVAVRLRIDRLLALVQAQRYGTAVADYHALQREGYALPAYAKAPVADALLQQRHPAESAALYEQSLRELPPPYADEDLDPRNGLMYAYVESGRYRDAIALADRTDASEPAWRWRHGTPTAVRNQRKPQSMLDAVLAREYAELLAQAQGKLDPMLREAPMNASFWRERGNLQRARGWPRQAEASQDIALGIDPTDTSIRLGLIDDWRDLYDFPKVEPALAEVERLESRNRQTREVRRSWDRQRGWQFDLEHDRGQGNTPNLGDSDHETRATLASPILGNHWRVTALTDLAGASLPEGSTKRERAGVGVIAYARGLQAYLRALTGVGSQTRGTSIEAGADWAMSDHWSVAADWSSKGDADTPLRAHYYGITARATHATVTWRASERTEAELGATRLRLTDGNRGIAWHADVMQRLFTAPQLALDGGVQVGSSRFTDQDAPYYSPARARWATANLRLQNMLWQRYERLWRQRVDVQAGTYEERNYGSSWIASVRYGQTFAPHAGLNFGWGLSWASQPYDGRRDSRTALDLTMHWGE